jgi:hypothetical protein
MGKALVPVFFNLSETNGYVTVRVHVRRTKRGTPSVHPKAEGLISVVAESFRGFTQGRVAAAIAARFAGFRHTWGPPFVRRLGQNPGSL